MRVSRKEVILVRSKFRLPIIIRRIIFCLARSLTNMPALTNGVHSDTIQEVNGINHSVLKKDMVGKPINTDIRASPDLSLAPSIFTPICHPRVEDAVRDVDGYYLQHWGFSTEAARKKFVAAGFSRVTCLYFPKALDERIQYACSLLTILFLVDGNSLQASLRE